MEKSHELPHELSQESLGQKVKKWSVRIGLTLSALSIPGMCAVTYISWSNKRRALESINEKIKPEMEAIRDACRDVLGQEKNNYGPEDCDGLFLDFEERKMRNK